MLAQPSTVEPYCEPLGFSLGFPDVSPLSPTLAHRIRAGVVGQHRLAPKLTPFRKASHINQHEVQVLMRLRRVG